MTLISLPVEGVSELISAGTAPTASQYMAYWGRTPRERYSRFVEAFLVPILVFFLFFIAYPLSWEVLWLPFFQAVQWNWDFWGGRDLVDSYDDGDENERWGWSFDQYERPRGLEGALFWGRLTNVCVVENAAATTDEEYDLSDSADYTMETDEMDQYTGNPYLLRVRLIDKQGRQLQVHA
jgi:hypothetical protein